MSFDRFDFEQAIMGVWTGNDDLDILLQAFDDEASPDEIMNLIIGIKALQQRKFQRLWDMFEEGVSQRKIL